MGMFLTIIESGGAQGTVNITAETIEFFIINSVISFEVANTALTWEIV